MIKNPIMMNQSTGDPRRARGTSRLLPRAAVFLGASLAVAAVMLPSSASAMGASSDKSLLDLYKEGGPIMHLILLCSIAVTSLGAYCAMTFRRAKMMPAELTTNLENLMAQRDLPSAYQLCKSRPCVMSNILADALTKANFERDMFNKGSMENSIADDCFRNETKMMVVVNYLNTFAVLAPMIGLLGTVSGMITSFSALTAGKAEATDLAKGIGEALIATGGGLLLAIPAMFLYFFFRGMLTTNMANVHKALTHMLDLFTGEAHAAPQVAAAETEQPAPEAVEPDATGYAG